MESSVLQIKDIIPFHVTDWSSVEKTDHHGETGNATWRTLQLGSLRIRVVEYSAGYKVDHWCKKGHILYCLDGELTTELNDGRHFILKKGMSYQVSDDVSCHRSVTEQGATLLIIDGDFLKINSVNREAIRNPWRM
jgi:hypothetical protein